MSQWYRQAIEVLPEALRQAAEEMADDVMCRAEEIRLRTGFPMTVTLPEGEVPTGSPCVREEDLRTVLERGSRCSVHTALAGMRAGFLTLRGGHRIGLCGEVAMEDGHLHAYRRLSSAAIRIARPVSGLGPRVLREILADGFLENTLILAPPGAGKTTLLRELVRLLSNGEGCRPCRVGLADERREISAMWEGCCQFDVGRQTDVVADCPKAEGAEILLRGMNPQVLAMDEITAQRDADALLWAAGCGVRLLATAHGGGVEDLRRRPLYRGLAELAIFSRVMVLRLEAGERRASVLKLT